MINKIICDQPKITVSGRSRHSSMFTAPASGFTGVKNHRLQSTEPRQGARIHFYSDFICTLVCFGLRDGFATMILLLRKIFHFQCFIMNMQSAFLKLNKGFVDTVTLQ